MEGEIRMYKTEGDEQTDQPLNEIGGKGLFTRALDQAMQRGEIDVVVHSAKDIPTDMEEGIGVVAMLHREDPRDVLLACDEQVDLDNLAKPPVIGTSSTRRRAFLRHYTPHVKTEVIRGNVDTRVRKMEAGEYDG